MDEEGNPRKRTNETNQKIKNEKFFKNGRYTEKERDRNRRNLPRGRMNLLSTGSESFTKQIKGFL